MKVKVAVAQFSSIFFDKEASISKLEGIVKKAAENDCQLVVFPESFIPGYPRGFDFGANVGKRTEAGRELFAEYHRNSISIDGEDRARLEKISKENNCYLVVGVTERMEQNGSLYCSMLYISPTNGLLGIHRKIKPTGTERLIWAEAGGDSFVTFDTEIGRMGGLICWENYMPLARMSMYQKGIQLYIAPTADSREEWTSTMIQIALEGRCYVIGCNQYFTKSMYPERFHHLIENEVEEICTGGSVIVSPHGKVINGPLFGTEELLISELDLNEVTKAKLDFDVNGHYARNDLFAFSVKDQPQMKKEN